MSQMKHLLSEQEAQAAQERAGKFKSRLYPLWCVFSVPIQLRGGTIIYACTQAGGCVPGQEDDRRPSGMKEVNAFDCEQCDTRKRMEAEEAKTRKLQAEQQPPQRSSP